MAKQKDHFKTNKGNRNISSIAEHKKDGKKLKPPFAQLKNVQFNSWTNERMPEVLWACLLTTLPRNVYLEIFREISSRGVEFKSFEKIVIHHTEMANLDDAAFDMLMQPALANADARSALAALLLFKNLPDRKHWARHLKEPDLTQAAKVLLNATAKNYDHQSEAATDCRWLKVRFMIMAERMILSHDRADQQVVEILDFPSKGDLRSVRPSIRAAEIAFSSLPGEKGTTWCQVFWEEGWSRTDCLVLDEDPVDLPDLMPLMKELGAIYDQVCAHFMQTVSTTDIDPKHDTVFGLVLYALYLAMELTSEKRSCRPIGRSLIRTMCESYVSFAFLMKRDNPTEWKQFRSYGSGQAKLSFLKLLSSEKAPEYIDMSELERFANEDMWQEYLDIDLGHWGQTNLRAMSEAAGVKDIYDKYYPWPSGYVHGHWGAIRDTVFVNCVNPLHRFHRVPRPPRINMNSTVDGAVKLMNLFLDKLNEAYPPFKPRIRFRLDRSEPVSPSAGSKAEGGESTGG